MITGHTRRGGSELLCACRGRSILLSAHQTRLQCAAHYSGGTFTLPALITYSQHLLSVTQIELRRLAGLDGDGWHIELAPPFAHAQSVRADVVRAVAIALLDALALPAFDRFLGRTRS